MAKLFNYYHDNIDRTWYDSSNIIYTECVDNANELKTLRVVFSNGTQYEYNGVNVNDYLILREDVSQGKAFNRLFRKGNYEYAKLDNVNLDELHDELMQRKGGGYFIRNEESGFVITDTKDNVKLKLDKKLNDETFELILNVMKATNVLFKVLTNESSSKIISE